MTNVFEFPKSKIVRDVPINIEEIEKAKEKGKKQYADGIVSEIGSGLIAELENYGIDLDDEEGGLNKDFLFLTDVLKSVVYRNMNIDHPLHTFVDDNVSIFENEDEFKKYIETQKEVQEESETE
jgi:hypothetical protein